MSRPRIFKYSLFALALTAATALTMTGVRASDVKRVFVIGMENHNWEQPDNKFTGGIQQLYQNPAAPYINSLVDGSNEISSDVAYAMAYHNVLATASGNNLHIHPSEPNYLWAEAGTNFGVLNDNDPYGSSPTHQHTSAHLTTLLAGAGYSWKSYQEDTDLMKDSNGKLTNFPLPQNQWTVPLASISCIFSSGFNSWNASTQYNYAAKHNPMVFFDDTAGNGDPTAANPMAPQYAPLQQFALDLSSGNVADYNWITPNQYNDMHTALTGGFQGLTGDPAKIKQGDYFLSQFIPLITASDAYKNHGVIVLWWDEAEGDGVKGDNADDFRHTVPFIIVSKDAAKNVNGLPYASVNNYSHSSFLKTMQEIFRVGPLLGDAANADDLSDLFKPGSFKKMN